MDITSFFVKKNSSSKAKSKTKSKARPKKNLNPDFPDIDEFKNQLLSWKSLLKSTINSPTFESIHLEVRKQYKENICYPPSNQIFNAFRQTHLNDLKIVIVGQDPYFKENQAMGLSFSVPKGQKIPPSLRNIYKCIKGDPDISGNFK